MITKIAKGTKNGLNFFAQRISYFHNEEMKWVQINYRTFCETPDGTRCFQTEQSVIVQDREAVIDKDGEGNDVVISPASSNYTDYCEQFNADAIGQAIDNYLLSI